MQCADIGGPKATKRAACRAVLVSYVSSHTAQGIAEYWHTGTFRRVNAAKDMLASGTVAGAAGFCAVHAIAWSEPHAEYLLGQLANFSRETQMCDVTGAVRNLRQAHEQHPPPWGDTPIYDREADTAGKWTKDWVMNPEKVERFVRSSKGAHVFDTIARAVRAGAVGAATQEEAITSAIKDCDGRLDYTATHLYRAICRVLRVKIESPELPRMGRKWNTARDMLLQTECSEVPLHNVPALNAAVGLDADWGDYGYYFCAQPYQAEMPVWSLKNRPHGPAAWIGAVTQQVLQQRAQGSEGHRQ